MSRPAPRSIDGYLNQLRAALAGEDPARGVGRLHARIANSLLITQAV